MKKWKKRTATVVLNLYATEHYTERRQLILVFNQLTPIQCSYSEIRSCTNIHDGPLNECSGYPRQLTTERHPSLNIAVGSLGAKSRSDPDTAIVGAPQSGPVVQDMWPLDGDLCIACVGSSIGALRTWPTGHGKKHSPAPRHKTGVDSKDWVITIPALRIQRT